MLKKQKANQSFGLFWLGQKLTLGKHLNIEGTTEQNLRSGNKADSF